MVQARALYSCLGAGAGGALGRRAEERPAAAQVAVHDGILETGRHMGGGADNVTWQGK